MSLFFPQKVALSRGPLTWWLFLEHLPQQCGKPLLADASCGDGIFDSYFLLYPQAQNGTWQMEGYPYRKEHSFGRQTSTLTCVCPRDLEERPQACSASLYHLQMSARGNFPPTYLISCDWTNHQIDTRQITGEKETHFKFMHKEVSQDWGPKMWPKQGASILFKK